MVRDYPSKPEQCRQCRDGLKLLRFSSARLPARSKHFSKILLNAPVAYTLVQCGSRGAIMLRFRSKLNLRLVPDIEGNGCVFPVLAPSHGREHRMQKDG